jgi:DNA (cytosine-5)-methyltransferase 1
MSKARKAAKPAKRNPRRLERGANRRTEKPVAFIARDSSSTAVVTRQLSERRRRRASASTTGGSPYTFIDLFAGIGGTRIAFEAAGCRCVFSSEWDRFAQITYEANFGEKPAGDIRAISSADIPDHDILVAGFPCQPFSISGVSKKKALGRPHGFEDPTQGTLFFELKRIIAEKRPQAFLLENVKHLKRHDHGNTFRVIMESLEQDLHYTVYHNVIDAVDYVPQHRERIYIVGFREPLAFTFPARPESKKLRFRDILSEEVPAKYTLTDHLWQYLQAYARKHKEKGNGFTFGLVDLDGHSRTLSARYHKDGSEILIPQDGKNPRRLTPLECARLMGFTQFRPDFRILVSDTQAYRQFGNSVVVPVVLAVAKRLVQALRDSRRVTQPVSALDCLKLPSTRQMDLFVARDRRRKERPCRG